MGTDTNAALVILNLQDASDTLKFSPRGARPIAKDHDCLVQGFEGNDIRGMSAIVVLI